MAVAIIFPTIRRMSLVSKLVISVRTSPICVESGDLRPHVSDLRSLLRAQLRNLRRQARVEVRNLGEHLSKASPELVEVTWSPLFKAVVDRLGCDFGLLTGNAPGGELPGDGECVEHTRSA